MEATPAVRIIFFLLAASLPAFGADSIDVGSSRQARHTLMPIIGYQFLTGEQRGIDWDFNFRTGQNDGFPDSTFYYSGTSRGEDDLKPPILGMLYRYRLNESLAIQASAAILQDRTRFVYPVIYEFFGFTSRNQIVVERKNTFWLNGGAGWEFKTPLDWLTGLAQFELGYATREILRERTGLESGPSRLNVTWVEDESMFSVRGGVDIILWRNENLLLEGGISYAQFFPVEAETDPFGGLGWRFSVFPVWSAR